MPILSEIANGAILSARLVVGRDYCRGSNSNRINVNKWDLFNLRGRESSARSTRLRGTFL